jgi:hypothetical protein
MNGSTIVDVLVARLDRPHHAVESPADLDVPVDAVQRPRAGGAYASHCDDVG